MNANGLGISLGLSLPGLYTNMNNVTLCYERCRAETKDFRNGSRCRLSTTIRLTT